MWKIKARRPHVMPLSLVNFLVYFLSKATGWISSGISVVAKIVSTNKPMETRHNSIEKLEMSKGV